MSARQQRRRQWGADQHVNPMPAVPRMTGDVSLAIGRAAVVITVAAWAALVSIVMLRQLTGSVTQRASTLQTIGFLVLVTLLSASAISYLVARLGFYHRARAHRRVPRAMLDAARSDGAPSVTVLVPSYQEEADVIRMTLLSAALQEYPSMRVVLLIDDPPSPRFAKPAQMLEDARALPDAIQKLLSGPRKRFDTAAASYEREPAGPTTAQQLQTLAAHYEEASRWLERLAEVDPDSDHNERFFATHVIGKLRADLALVASALRSAAGDDPTKLARTRVAELYRRLAWTFRCELTSFERKSFSSLSAEANKAMNLNSYIGLMGGQYDIVQTPGGRTLVPVEAGGDLVVPDSDYVLTLDADSVIMPEYCLRLVDILEQPVHARVAVAQTPYSAFPGAATRLERIAGATTDLQHIVHQGMTFYGASFWVGANAVLRKAALDEIVQTEYTGGWPIHRYIQDRTVIEDTESTIDLTTRGWDTYNFPERLSYSATPPDFGSLCIQRHRWANGGLLIVPKLWRCVRQRRLRGETTSAGEMLLRINYMASVFWSSLAVLLLLTVPFDAHLLTPLTFVAAAPYFVAMSIDLRYCGYKYTDVLRIYGFNLLLLPVNLAGSLSSVAQGLTGTKGQFRRTPKVRDRTVPAFVYVTLPYLLVAVSVYTFLHAYHRHIWGDAAFAALNALLCAYAIVAFVGIRHSIVDIWINVTSWLYKPPTFDPLPPRAEPASVDADHELADWELVLHLGFGERRRTSRDAATK